MQNVYFHKVNVKAILRNNKANGVGKEIYLDKINQYLIKKHLKTINIFMITFIYEIQNLINLV